MTDPAAPSHQAAPSSPAITESADPEPATAAATSRRSALRIVGAVVAVIALALCGVALWRDGQQVVDSFQRANPWLVAVGLLASAGSMAWLAVLWSRCLAALGADAPLGSVMRWYFVGELGKYVPGGVWQIVGRGELAQQHPDISRRISYLSTLLAYATMCLGAVGVCAVASPWIALSTDSRAWWLTPGLVAVPVLAHPAPIRGLISLVARLTRRQIAFEPLPWRTTMTLTLWSVPAFAMLGAASSALSIGLGFDDNPLRIAVAAVIAWLVGFLAIAVPAGAGVREIVFATFSGMATGPAVAVALTARVLLVAVDGVGGLIGLAAGRVSARSERV